MHKNRVQRSALNAGWVISIIQLYILKLKCHKYIMGILTIELFHFWF